jgi:hypothetical protein
MALLPAVVVGAVAAVAAVAAAVPFMSGAASALQTKVTLGLSSPFSLIVVGRAGVGY